MAVVESSRGARRALRTILAVGIAGLVFSGYLTWRELFATFRTAACAPVG